MFDKFSIIIHLGNRRRMLIRERAIPDSVKTLEAKPLKEYLFKAHNGSPTHNLEVILHDATNDASK